MGEIWLCYDLLAPDSGPGSRAVAKAAIEQVAWADDKGFSRVLLPEHHGSPDNYNPSPFMVASAMAARTKSLRFVLGAILIPLHNPLRIAEDAAVLDNLSGGRLDLVPAVGYVPSEFDMFGVSLGDRAALIDESIEVLRQAFTGQSFSYRGRHARVTPRPVQRPGPPIYVGGAVTASARRAARLGDGFFPTIPTPELIQVYRDECANLGKPAGPVLNYGNPLFVHVASDPEKAWSRILPHAVREMTMYGQWVAEASAVTGTRIPFSDATPDADRVRASNIYAVVTPAECATLAKASWAEGRTLNFKPMMGGLAPELAWESLELFATQVLPRLDSSG